MRWDATQWNGDDLDEKNMRHGRLERTIPRTDSGWFDFSFVLSF